MFRKDQHALVLIIYPSDQCFSSHHFPPFQLTHQRNPVQEKTVNGQRAIWAVGPYPLRIRDGDLQFMRLIEGHVLIWTENNITYRLETDLSLEETIKIAESLEPIR